MGNDEIIENMKNKYYLNVCIIGEGQEKQLLNLIQSFKIKNIKKRVEFKKEEDLNNIYDYWDWNFNFQYPFKEQCIIAFQLIKKIKIDEKELKLCLVVNVDNMDSKNVEFVLDKINKIKDKNYMPLTLFLCDNKIIFSKNKYPNIDERIIFTEKGNYFADDYEINPIQKTLLTFCSIYNKLGDNFTVGIEKKVINYNLIDKVFPYNLNIACIGKIEKDKSKCINILLNEMRISENNLDNSLIKNGAYYQVKNYPIKIINIPNFENLKSIKNAVLELEKMQGKLFTSKEKLHIILYIIDSNSSTFFLKEEILLFKELINYKEAKILFVFTNSTKSIVNQNEIIEKVKFSLFNLISQEKDESKRVMSKMVTISLKNSVFLNFAENEEYNLGINELFNKINLNFKSTQSYKKSLIPKTQNDVEKEAHRLKEKAKDEIISNKIESEIIEKFSINDFLIEKLNIKRNALIRIIQIFGIDSIKIEEIKNDKSNKKILLETEINQERISIYDLFKREKKDIYFYIKDYEELKQIINKDNKYIDMLLKKDIDISAFVDKFRDKYLEDEFGIYLKYIPGIGFVYCINKELNYLLDKFYNVYLKYGIFFKSLYLEASHYLDKMKTKHQKEGEFRSNLFIYYIILLALIIFF